MCVKRWLSCIISECFGSGGGGGGKTYLQIGVGELILEYQLTFVLFLSEMKE